MKRLTALAAALLFAALAACTTTTKTNTGAGNTNANTNANAAATATPAGVSQADIETKERQVWDAMKAKNYDAFASMLSDDFTYVTNDGAHTKAETVEVIKKYDLTDYTFSDLRFLKVDQDLVVLVYTSTEKSTAGGKPTTNKPSYNASAWANRGGNWVAVYHQDTLSGPPPPPEQDDGVNANTSGNKNSNANTSASPSATPASPTSATEAERAIWAALKAKNYDAFANFLMSDALEIEPDKVYTRAESIEAVKHLNASKFTQSDFKEVKLDADATLVTYVVTGPSLGKTVTERHSTIWTNRGGQWKAAFHQGTPQEK